MTYQELKDRQRQERETHGEFLGIRIHRALSWLNRAEQCADDSDSHVIFLWIAFNAAYALVNRGLDVSMGGHHPSIERCHID